MEIIPLNVSDANVMQISNTIYGKLTDAGIDVLMDDRDHRPGFKFKDADLIGIPLRITIGGKGLAEGIAEVKWRTESDAKKIPLADVVGAVQDLIAARRQ